MVGQDELLSKLKSYSINNFPHSVIFVGPKGCGKHTLVKELSDYFSIPAIDITSNLNYDFISDIQLCSVNTFFIIDIEQLTEKEQNIILKFIEEPSSTAHIILLSTDSSGILKTVLNRCMIYSFTPYTKDVLSSFLKEVDSKDLLSYCVTPGQIINSHVNLEELEKLCDTIVCKLKLARFDNALSISSKLNYKDNYDKFDIDVFLNVLQDKLYSHYILTKSIDSFKLYNILLEYKKRLKDVRINKKILIDNMIINMWKGIR